MSKYKLIAYDLDGTILIDHKYVSENTQKALKKAHDMGIILVPATGRFFSNMPKPVQDLPNDYAITVNGAAIFDLKENKEIISHTFSNERAIEILDWMDTLDCIYDCYFDNKGYVQENHTQVCEKVLPNNQYIDNYKYERIHVENLKEFVKNSGKPVQKVQLFAGKPEIVSYATRKGRELYPDMQVTGAELHDVEFNAFEAAKGSALLGLAKSLGISRDEIIAFGDGGNDINMLEAAGLGICMENGKQIAKDAADFITKSNDEDGIVYALEKFVF